jgi:hypothetical protein
MNRREITHILSLFLDFLLQSNNSLGLTVDIFIGEGEKAEAATTVEAMIKAVVFMLFVDMLVIVEVNQ